MRAFLGVLVGVYIFGVFVNGAIIQYREDPYGCRKESSNVFYCPWSPEREGTSNQSEITKRVLLWPVHVADLFAKAVQDDESAKAYSR